MSIEPHLLVYQGTDGEPILFHVLPVRNDSGILLNQESLDTMPAGWHELADYTENWEAHDHDHIVRVFEGPWASRQAFVIWALGLVVPGETITGISRSLPAQHPEYPWLYAISVRDVRGQGVWVQAPYVKDTNNRLVDMIAFTDGSNTGSDELSCKLAVHYGPLNYEIRTDADLTTIVPPPAAPPVGPDTPPPPPQPITEIYRYVERTEEYSLRSLPLPGGQLFFVEGPDNINGTAVPNSAGQIYLPMQELTYRWYRVPDPPTGAFAKCQGFVNQDPFDAQVLIYGSNNVPHYIGMIPNGYAPETLLCQAPHKTRTRGPTGRVEWTITYKFMYNVFGWNHFPASDGGFYRALFPNSNVGVYQTADFNKLFLPPQEGGFNYQ